MQGLYKPDEITFDIDLEEVIKALGYGKNKSSPAPEVLRQIQTCLKQAKQLIKPAAIYTVKTFRQKDNQTFYLDNSNFITPKVSSVLTLCDEVVIFLVTIGIDLETKASEFIKTGESLTGLVFDSVGSIATELTADWLQENIEKKLNSAEFCITHRYSPGYCDWDTQEQRKLLSLLDTESVGVELTESLMMRPRKSISGVFGILSKTNLPKLKNPCSFCAQNNCDHRRSASKAIYKSYDNHWRKD